MTAWKQEDEMRAGKGSEGVTDAEEEVAEVSAVEGGSEEEMQI